MWISIPELQREHGVHKGRQYGRKTITRLNRGDFGRQGETWRMVAVPGVRHKYEVNKEGAKLIVAFWESQNWTGTA
jgi:hypothetical protein